MLTIESSNFKVEINELGAELTHLENKQDHFNYLWSGDAWKRHAPILFPSIGKSYEDKYRIGTKEYPMKQHGFARDYEWEVKEQGPNFVTLTFEGNDETKKMYPFDYTLSVNYSVDDQGVKVHYALTNHSPDNLAFSLGAHPAFNVPLAGAGEFADYYLDFGENTKELNTYGIDPAPFRNGARGKVILASGKLPLTRDFFRNGLIVFDQPSQQVTLRSEKTSHYVTVQSSEFPYMTLWTVEDGSGEFICIEPFAGLPDQYGDVHELFTKEGNQVLASHHRFSINYQIKLG